ncbi:MAG: methionine--tRNA ligase [bacterium]
MPRPLYITTPIYYINDRPHIGHAYTTVAADYITRFYRLGGRESFFLTGTDEHGSKVAEAAARADLSEIEFCDRTVRTFQKAWQNLSIEYDGFIRTTSARHEQAVRKILDAMRNARTPDGREVIYQGYYEGLYCTGCEKFVTEKELVDGRCPDHNRPPEKLKEKNYFFRLTAFLPQIRDKINSGELLVLPEERRREVLGLIEQDLPDFSLSRETVKWGIPLTFDNSQSAYVWVDALSNYISGIGYGDDPVSFDKWWNSGEVVHLMAKDILKFHCLYWPAMLMAAGVKLPDVIYLHGFFTVDGEKMSKTLGNMIDPNDMVAEFGPDATRYLMLTQYPFGTDGDVKAKQFVTQYNSDLANDLGNLVSRVVKMIKVNFDGALPEPRRKIKGLQELMELAEALPGTVHSHVKRYELGKAIAAAMNLVRATNKFFNDHAPWIMAKEGRKLELGGVLYACCEIIRIVSIVLFPVMPGKMRTIRDVLGLDDSTLTLDAASTFFDLKPGTPVILEDAIFPRLKPTSGSADEPAKAAPVVESTPEGTLLDISEFARVKLRVADVLEAERVPGTSKLLKLRIDLGSEQRQIVAGVAEHYPPEKITGMKIIVVTNLKPAVIRGIESNGMLLTAQSGKKLVLLTPDGDLPAGAKIS